MLSGCELIDAENMKMGDFDVCIKKNPMNITIKGKMQQS
jgi:hypothetical protein